MRNTFVAMMITAVTICAAPQRPIAQAQGESSKAKGYQEDGFIAQKLTPLATDVYRPKEWFFWQDNASGDFTWIISKEKLDEANRQFQTGCEIKAFYDVSKKSKKSPLDFATEYLEKSFESQEIKIIQRSKQKAGPLTALTQTIELADEIIATDLYWGDEKQLDVVVVVTRRAPKTEWNASQRLFQKLAKFNLRTVVEGTRDNPRNDDGKNK